ncbi:MAG: VOC family protein [Corynebacterium sp.]|uniref:VOC family protein n=1 Tax=Corynebacterium TaxID=1716 RepID=UPI00264804E4|nr:VOC family protein [Corynebacterium sp.]MDN6283064.1 VOC family protein [Corynebacterium sp.]MDN6306494.1 VOC family protein [Corynebacterium sp.]MDN6352247.1 VOC family protein [Corynebacterium sp.]MDN6368563.1 VOC family protein [Corynebacterium sp.]MDN6376255.1 VOC family protein [Corynebacterium sp.]
MSTVRQIQITFDCADPRRVAGFWKAVLGYVDPAVPEGFRTWESYFEASPGDDDNSFWACQDPEGVGPRLFFQRVPEPKTTKNRVHVDVRVGAGLVGDERLAVLESEASRLEKLGARRVRLLPADGENESCQVMQDIEGNEFCLD